jgi:hypothetical protein
MPNRKDYMKPKLGKWQRLIIQGLLEADKARGYNDPPPFLVLDSYLRQHLKHDLSLAEYSAAFRAASSLEKAGVVRRVHAPAQHLKRGSFSRSLLIYHADYGPEARVADIDVFEHLQESHTEQAKRVHFDDPE